MHKIAAVVVTYNRKEMLEQCIAALMNQQDANCDILIVDNNSTDGTHLVMEQYKNQGVQYKKLNENIGGAGGFNTGMRWAVEQGYDAVWIMDDDTLPSPDALSALLQADRHLNGEYGWLSSVALWTDGHECKMNRAKLKKSFYEYSEYLKYGIIQAEQATFVSMFFRAETIRKAGLPIREFFIWGDDIEYSRRISVRMNMPCFVVGASQVVHAMKENNGSSIANDQVERIARYNYAFRNENYLYRQEGVRGFVYYMAKCALNLCRIWAKAPNYKAKRSAIIIKNFFGGFFFQPRVEYIEKGI